MMRATKYLLFSGLAAVLFLFWGTMACAAGTEPFTVEITARVRPDMGEFIFTLGCYEDEHNMFRTKTITIKDVQSGKEIQTLKIGDFNDGEDAQTFSRDTLELLIEDMDFDGFADMRIMAFAPAGPNIPYICWLWDKGKKQFVHDAELSEITSLEVDHENKWITCSNRVNAVSRRREFYRYIDGKLTLFKAEDVFFDDDGETCEIVTWELKDGTLTETDREKY